MLKKIVTITLTILILSSAFLLFDQNVSALTGDPTKLGIFTGPPNVLADNNTYKCIAVQLQDVNSKPARAQQDTTISLSSSSTNIGTADPSIIISKGSTYAFANFNSTNTPGTTTITAAATGYTTVQSSITTMSPSGLTPSKLAVYCVPPTLPSDALSYPAIQVQLQDSSGRPTTAVGTDVPVSLFSSDPTVGVVSSTLTVPTGKTQTTASLTTTNAGGITTITATASNYTTGTATMNTYLIDYSPLQVALTANPSNTNNGNNVQITAYITADGSPITGAAVTFTSNNGGTFSAQQQGNGYYNTTFTAPNFSQTTTCTITASATKTNYLDSQGTTQVTVTPNAAPTPTPTTSGNGATIQLCVKDIDNNPLNNTLVSSIIQPSGMTTLTDITNSSGYVTFQNPVVGSYTFKIVRVGSESMNATIDFTGQPIILPITLLSSNSTADSNSPADYGVLLITAIVLVIIVVAVVSSILVVRRKKSERIRKLQELQKQLKRKY